MFGDFFRQFGFDDLLEGMRNAQQQPPFNAGAVDPQGGVFGRTAGPPADLHMPGLGGGPQMPAGAPGPGGAPGAPGTPAPPPTASAVAQRPALTALSPGGGSPLGPPQPGQPGQQLPKGPLEQGVDESFARYRSNQGRRPSDFASFG